MMALRISQRHSNRQLNKRQTLEKQKDVAMDRCSNNSTIEIVREIMKGRYKEREGDIKKKKERKERKTNLHNICKKFRTMIGYRRAQTVDHLKPGKNKDPSFRPFFCKYANFVPPP
jgi:hypothetical protein